MRKKAYPVSRLTGGLDLSLDAMLITDSQSPNLELVRFHKGILKKDLGFLDFANTLSEVPMHMDTFYEVDGTEHLMCWSVDYTYRYSSGSWTKITGCNTWTGDEDNIFYSVIMPDSAGTLIIISGNGKDAPQKWDGTTWAALGGWGAGNVIPWYLITFRNYLISIGSTESGTQCPFRIRWSNTADPENISSGLAKFFDLVDTVDWCVGAVLMEDRCLIIKERSIWELIHIGGADVFEARLVIDGVGSYCIKSVISLGSEIIFFGSDDVYLFDGVQLESIGTQMFPLFYDTETKIVNHSKIHRACAIYVEELAEYWLCLPTSGETSDWLVKYNFDNKAWSQRDLQVNCWGYYSAQETPDVWTDWSSAWNSGDYDEPWRRKALPGSAPITLYGDHSKKFYQDDRLEPSSGEMIWESKDWLFAHGERILEIRYYVRGDDFEVCYSTDGGLSYSTWETLSPDSNVFKECVQYLNFTCQTFRVKIRTSDNNFELKWIEPWYIPRQRSKELF